MKWLERKETSVKEKRSEGAAAGEQTTILFYYCVQDVEHTKLALISFFKS